MWGAAHHLIRVYYSEKAGDAATAALVRRLGTRAEPARDLAYRLFELSERKKRSQEDQAYNALVLAWPEIVRLSWEHGQAMDRLLAEAREGREGG